MFCFRVLCATLFSLLFFAPQFYGCTREFSSNSSGGEMGLQLHLLLLQMCLIAGALPFHGSAGNKFDFLVLVFKLNYIRSSLCNMIYYIFFFINFEV